MERVTMTYHMTYVTMTYRMTYTHTQKGYVMVTGGICPGSVECWKLSCDMSYGGAVMLTRHLICHLICHGDHHMSWWPSCWHFYSFFKVVYMTYQNTWICHADTGMTYTYMSCDMSWWPSWWHMSCDTSCCIFLYRWSVYVLGIHLVEHVMLSL